MPAKKKEGKKTNFLYLGLLAILSIPVIFFGSAIIYGMTRTPSSIALSNVEKKLRETMKDPDSMVIRSSYFITEKEDGKIKSMHVCGVVDGRNGFGGYQGGIRFVADMDGSSAPDVYHLELDDGDESLNKFLKGKGMLTPFEKVYWNGGCVDEYHPALTASSEPNSSSAYSNYYSHYPTK